MTGTKLAISNSSGGCVPRVPRGNDTNESIVGVKLRYAHRLFGQLQRPLFCRWLKALVFFLLLFFSLCASVDPTSDERVNARTHSSPLHLLIYSKRLTFRSQSAFSSLKSLLFFSQELDFFFFFYFPSTQQERDQVLCVLPSTHLSADPYRSSCSAVRCPMALCWRAGLCFAELAPDGGPLYSENTLWHYSK